MTSAATVSTLYPSNATALELAIEQAFAQRIEALTAEVGAVVSTAWSAADAPVHMLDRLAWACGVVAWRADWPEAYKRSAIAAAKPTRRRIGTLGAVLQTLAALGQPAARVSERSDGVIYRDTSLLRDQGHTRGEARLWATMRIYLPQPITANQASALRSAIDAVKRNCVHLVALDYSANPVLRDAGYARDAGYSRGIV